MPQSYPSIFNDVIGPVMRGPSSSHCAAAVRIGRLARDLMDGQIYKVLIQFDPDGSLATTHKSQGSDMGLFGGLLGWEPQDERLVDSGQALVQAGIEACFQITPLRNKHPNAYRLIVENAQQSHVMVALSIGGGMVEVVELDGVALTIGGDYDETLIYCQGNGKDVLAHVREHVPADQVLWRPGEGGGILQIKAQRPLSALQRERILALEGVYAIKHLAPVLPIRSRAGMMVPFRTCEEMLAYNAARDLSLWELAGRYESARGNLLPEQVLARMVEIVTILREALARGLAGTVYEDRILGNQSSGYARQWQAGQLLDGGMLNRMTLYVTALMENKSAMGVLVAAPTAGACGGLPGACLGAADHLDLPDQEVAKALLAGGLIGVFIARGATFAAEVGGCQAECGAGSGMAAAALVTLAGGTAAQAVNGAAMALQNILGMICDPVANRVEVPCLGKNVLAAANALTCANMALADFDPVIPLDQVIETMDRVGKSLPHELRCTALGGLSITPASRALEARLAQRN